jgi:excisionase family DNA binding protein
MRNGDTAIELHAATTSDRQGPLAVSVPEAARLLGISRGLAYELVARGDLPSVRLGRRLVVPRHALVALVDDASSIRDEHVLVIDS